MKAVFRSLPRFLLLLWALSLGACSTVNLGVTLPIGSHAGVGVSVGTDGRVGVGVGVNVKGGQIGVGTSTQLPTEQPSGE